MNTKRKLAIKERRAASVISDALRTGSSLSTSDFPTSTKSSLRPTDHQGAVDLLRRTLPDVARLQQRAIHVLAATALRQAIKTLSTDPNNQESAFLLRSQPSSQQPVLKASAVSPSPPVNSNDLLPSIRPRISNSLLHTRRRISRTHPASSASDTATTYVVPRPLERFDCIGGIKPVLDTLRELVEWPLSRRELYDHLGVDPPRGILLHGPPGCGKTLLANAVAGELGVPFLRISAPEVVSGVSGESERKLRIIFSEAVYLQPSIIFIDEVDAIASSRDGASKDMERRIVSQLLSCIDALSSPKHHPDFVNVASNAELRVGDEDSTELLEEGDNIQPANQDSVDCHIEKSEKDGDGDVKDKPPSVVVIAATNRPESLEPALRRAGRFDKEIELGAPDEEGRFAILEKLCGSLRLDNSFEVGTIAKRTAGYVGADLHLLVKEAGLACIRRVVKKRTTKSTSNESDEDMHDCRVDAVAIAATEASGVNDKSRLPLGSELETDFENGWCFTNAKTYTEDGFQISEPSEKVKSWFNGSSMGLEDCAISMKDFEEGLARIQPSALREGFATRPNACWDKVGSLELVREEMIMAIVEPIRRPKIFSSLGLHAAGGVLLYGPPGCGKTLLARAVASESGANFISVKGPELLSKYVGDSELAVRKLFARARCSAPCVIFFDELDALAPRRGGASNGDSSGASERVVNMLLTEMDGFNDRKQVFLIAATNRPDIIDPAMLRPGRLDKLIFVPLPDRKGRASILKTLLKGVRVDSDIRVEEITEDPRCEGFSGADLQALIRVAGETALKEVIFDFNGDHEDIDKGIKIKNRHFQSALDVVMPSVSPGDAKSYESMESWLRKSRGHMRSDKNTDSV